jgi:amino acid adenylation domain-containing protein
MKEDNFNLALPFYRNSLQYPQLIAISAEGTSLSYSELAERAQTISGWLRNIHPQGKVGRVGILASRSIEACAGVLGTCWAGGTYVPIGLKLPEDRLQSVITLSMLDAIITDLKGTKLLSEKLLCVCPKHILVLDKKEQPHGLNRNAHSFVSQQVPPVEHHEPIRVNPEDTGYIEFTSGTTGVPKGVMISAAGVHQYISVIQERYRISPDDRVAETADLSFDISVSNMFATWNAGASLHVIPATQAMAPARFIQDNQITFWYSVPSIITFMKSIKTLLPGAFPALRCSIFAGEPLPVSAALSWQEAAPNSIVHNLYGPTEATVVCLAQPLTTPPTATEERGVVAIGTPFPGTDVAVVDSTLKFLPPGETGEIALSGTQLAIGYFGSPELTKARFPVIDGKRWYLTGDLGFQDKTGIFHHLGRIDNQVKVMGNRVELEEVETHLRKVCNIESVAAVAWPTAHGSASGIVGFVAGTQMSSQEIKTALKSRIPVYMIPNTIYAIAAIPTTANGKTDRKALLETLNGGLTK